MNYVEFRDRKSFTQLELLAFANGTLISDAPAEFKARLPLPPMLMIHRILEIDRQKTRGRIVAEYDVRLDDWFFQCHFASDPVQPGCLGVDGIWQLLGFFCAWSGGLGAGRALGCGEVEFFGQVRPHDRLIRYEVDVRRYTELTNVGASVVLGDATLFVDDEPIYSVQRAKVGTFRNIDYPDYPRPSKHSRGGRLVRES